VTVFSDLDVRAAISRGEIVCCPLRLENIKGSSVDLTLGEWFWRCDANPYGVFNPYDEAEISRYFAGPFRAKPYASVYEKMARSNIRWTWPLPSAPFKNISEDWPVIVVRPRERILVHSHEFVGIRGRGTTMLKARSSVGRFGLQVCGDAGWGDPGFINRWAWELRNDNDEAIVIPLGERLAQIIFFETGPVENPYYSKYQALQAQQDLYDLVENWRPEDMLPRAYKDERKAPLPVSVDAYFDVVQDMYTDDEALA